MILHAGQAIKVIQLTVRTGMYFLMEMKFTCAPENGSLDRSLNCKFDLFQIQL